MGKAVSTSGAIFNEVVRGKNIITPDVIGFYQNGDFIMELSEGTGFSGDPVYGVTVVSETYKEHEKDLSQMFHSRKEAINYMNTGVRK